MVFVVVAIIVVVVVIIVAVIIIVVVVIIAELVVVVVIICEVQTHLGKLPVEGMQGRLQELRRVGILMVAILSSSVNEML